GVQTCALPIWRRRRTTDHSADDATLDATLDAVLVVVLVTLLRLPGLAGLVDREARLQRRRQRLDERRARGRVGQERHRADGDRLALRLERQEPPAAHGDLERQAHLPGQAGGRVAVAERHLIERALVVDAELHPRRDRAELGALEQRLELAGHRVVEVGLAGPAQRLERLRGQRRPAAVGRGLVLIAEPAHATAEVLDLELDAGLVAEDGVVGRGLPRGRLQLELREAARERLEVGAAHDAGRAELLRARGVAEPDAVALDGLAEELGHAGRAPGPDRRAELGAHVDRCGRWWWRARGLARLGRGAGGDRERCEDRDEPLHPRLHTRLA